MSTAIKHVTKKTESPLKSSTPLIFVQYLLHEAQGSGRDIPQLLNSANIHYPAQALIDGEIKEITIEEYCRLFQVISSIWQQEAGYGDGVIHTTSNTLRHLGQSLVSANTLEQVIDQAANFFRMFSLFEHAIEIRKNDNEIYFSMKRVSSSKSQSVLAAELNGLSTLHRLFSWLIGEYIPLTEVGLFGKASKMHSKVDMLLVFHCPIKIDQNCNYMRFPASFMERAVVQNADSLEKFIPIAPYVLGTISDPKDSLSERIRCIIGEDLSRDLPGIDQLSEMLHISTTTLRRHLRQENTSYQKIKDNCRKLLAMKLLTQPTPSIDTIAEKVGFSDANTFSRAFKKWTGKSPSAFRDLKRK